MNYYMAVTPDEYELPLAIEENHAELARRFNMRPNNLLEYIAKQRTSRKHKCKFIRVNGY
jgi:hypothetical protein